MQASTSTRGTRARIRPRRCAATACCSPGPPAHLTPIQPAAAPRKQAGCFLGGAPSQPSPPEQITTGRVGGCGSTESGRQHTAHSSPAWRKLLQQHHTATRAIILDRFWIRTVRFWAPVHVDVARCVQHPCIVSSPPHPLPAALPLWLGQPAGRCCDHPGQ